ncbi:hypothetical protein [Butyricimonas synergistica]|uniref:hypothetical protein n=1 Tax=Butyricimonas synergistica TaxID=544644 RepID=UPI00047616AF|nr:hypothetical protein [Butyricimonas synergistica]
MVLVYIIENGELKMSFFARTKNCLVIQLSLCLWREYSGAGREFLNIIARTPPALRATSSINRGGAGIFSIV